MRCPPFFSGRFTKGTPLDFFAFYRFENALTCRRNKTVLDTFDEIQIAIAHFANNELVDAVAFSNVTADQEIVTPLCLAFLPVPDVSPAR